MNKNQNVTALQGFEFLNIMSEVVRESITKCNITINVKDHKTMNLSFISEKEISV